MGKPPENEPPSETGRDIGERIAKIGRRTAWVVPITAIATITLSVLQLEITPDAWQKPATDALKPITGIKTDPLVCLTAGSIMLIYWLARDGWDAIIKGSIMIGIKIAWNQVKEEIRVKAHAEGKVEGHKEGRVEGRAEGRAEAYAELKGKTLSEIAEELGIAEATGPNGKEASCPSDDSGQQENAC